MSNKPKGAMGSPYNSSEDSLGKMMGDAFDRLHENSWDGGKQKKKEREEKQIDNINAEIDKKLQENNVDCCLKDNPIIQIDSTSSININKTFSSDTKKEMMNIILDNNFDINEITNEKIIFTTDRGKFVILPL